MRKRSWKPKRIGKKYCAPACGRGCTHQQYKTAHQLADALIKKCEKEVGGKWTKRVHENLGWHYSVSLMGGDITIHEYKGDKIRYTVASHYGGTPIQVSMRIGSNSLKWLVQNQLRAVQKEADRWNDYLERNKKALNKK